MEKSALHVLKVREAFDTKCLRLTQPVLFWRFNTGLESKKVPHKCKIDI